MAIRNAPDRWGIVQQFLHWVVALAVLTQVVLGVIFSALHSDDPTAGQVLTAHASLGLSILGLMVVRALWRLSNPVPRLPDTLTPSQQRLARGTHWLFYVLLLAMPVGGYLVVSTHGQPVPFFGLMLPAAVGESESIHHLGSLMHMTGAVVLGLLILLHVAGALRHEFVLQDSTLRRMLPLVPERRQTEDLRHGLQHGPDHER